MALSKLDIELGKIDMKFTEAKYIRDKPALEFFIRYCHPVAIEREGDGIAVGIRRFKEDVCGKDGPFILSKTYPSSLEGLFDARAAGISAVKMLYNLGSIYIEEINVLLDPSIVREDRIYRLNLDQFVLHE